MSEIKDAVASHYNAMPNNGKRAREDSKIIHMRKFNNWVKSILIKSYCRSDFRVLDLAGGKGGDLQKWDKGYISTLILADIARTSVEDARERYNKGRYSFHATFIAADCCSVSLEEHLPNLDMVSCQFALHYSFESEERARNLLRNATCKLKKGGYFIGTIPDAEYLIDRVKKSDTLRFGNSVYHVEFEDKNNFPIFGCKYVFHLEDAVISLPEYLVHFPTFVKLAEEFDLELVEKERFHDFYRRNIKNRGNAKLFDQMGCFNREGTMSDDEWEATGIYMCFAFQKRGDSRPYRSDRPSSRPSKVDNIIVL